jgi:hypothetical protein
MIECMRQTLIARALYCAAMPFLLLETALVLTVFGFSQITKPKRIGYSVVEHMGLPNGQTYGDGWCLFDRE